MGYIFLLGVAEKWEALFLDSREIRVPRPFLFIFGVQLWAFYNINAIARWILFLCVFLVGT